MSGKPMCWMDAVKAMQIGHSVQRHRDAWVKKTGDSVTLINGDGEAITLEGAHYELGREPYVLVAGWTDDDKPVMVFMGALSRQPFVPDPDDMEAIDWMVDPECREL